MPIHDINYPTSICPSESGNCGKEGKKLQKLEYLQNKKSFLDEMKNIFHSFWRTIIWWKNKNLIKGSFTYQLKTNPWRVNQITQITNESIIYTITIQFLPCDMGTSFTRTHWGLAVLTVNYLSMNSLKKMVPSQLVKKMSKVQSLKFINSNLQQKKIATPWHILKIVLDGAMAYFMERWPSG